MIWCVEDDASIRDIEVYALQSTGLEARPGALRTEPHFGKRCKSNGPSW